MNEIINSPLGRALLALPLVVLGNILFGAAKSGLKGEFNKDVFLRGLMKGITIYAGIALLALASVVSNITIDMAGDVITLVDAMHLVIWGAVILYAKECIEKLASIFTLNTQEVENETNI